MNSVFNKIEKNSKTYAIIVDASKPFNGVEFLTDQLEEFQVGIMLRDHSNNVPKHIHNENLRNIKNTSECLLVLDGEIELNLWDEENIFIKSLIIKAPSVITLFRGYHELVFRKPTKLIEIKQGPYKKGKDKIYE